MIHFSKQFTVQPRSWRRHGQPLIQGADMKNGKPLPGYIESLWQDGEFRLRTVMTKFLKRACEAALTQSPKTEPEWRLRVAHLRALAKACEVFIDEMVRDRDLLPIAESRS